MVETQIDRLTSPDMPQARLLYHLAISQDVPLIEPMKLPFGAVRSRPSGILSIHLNVDGNVTEGFGEGATLPEPIFTDDSGQTIAKSATLILDNLMKNGQTKIGNIIEGVANFKFPDGHQYPTARMMVEMAILDAYSKGLGKSMLDLLGVPKDVDSVYYGKSIGEGSTADILHQCKSALNRGASKLKLKISPNHFSETIEAINLLRVMDGVVLMVDANGTFDSDNPTHIEMLRQLDGAGLLMIEEPVSRVGNITGIEAVRNLRKNIQFNTKICLDDCLKDLDTTKLALQDGTADIVNIKPGRIGSIIQSVRLATFCRSLGKDIMVGGMLEATPGRCMTVTLAALFKSMGFEIPGDISLPQERLFKDIVRDNYLLAYNTKGEVILPKDYGWGFGAINLSSL